MLDYGRYDDLPEIMDGVRYSRKPMTCGLRDMPTMTDVKRYVDARVEDVGIGVVPERLRPTLKAMRSLKPVPLAQAMETLDALDLHAVSLPIEYLEA